MIGGALVGAVPAAGPRAAAAPDRDALIRADLAFLAIELVLIGLLIINLHTSSASHIAAAALHRQRAVRAGRSGA